MNSKVRNDRKGPKPIRTVEVFRLFHSMNWRCLHCGHKFDAAVDADLFWCGDDCAGKHPGDATSEEVPQFPVPEGWLAFGSLVDYKGPSECSEEVGRDGLPLWERVIPPATPDTTEPRP